MEIEIKKLYWMIKKDALTLWRHKPRLISMYLFPILMIVLFGYGMGGELKHIPTVIVTESHGHLTDNTISAIKKIDIYDVKDVTSDVNKAKNMVKNGKVKAAIILPKNYENYNENRTVTVYVDSSDQIASESIIQATKAIFTKIQTESMIKEMKNIQLVMHGVQPTGFNLLGMINVDIKKAYGDIRYIDFLTPGILAMTVMMACMFAMGATIAGERERGELPRLFMTPTNVSTVLIGKILSRLTLETGRALVLLFCAIILFSVSVKGNILLVILLLVLTALCFIGLGIMISGRVETQEDYSQIVMPIAMPMMFISGVFYPIETMPWIFQKIAYLLPLTYANLAIRSVMLKGASLGTIWPYIAVLIGYTLLFFVLGVKGFRRDM